MDEHGLCESVGNVRLAIDRFLDFAPRAPFPVFVLLNPGIQSEGAGVVDLE